MRRLVKLLLMGCLLTVSVIGVAEDTRKWKKLKDDGLHDPTNPDLPNLQEPGDALRGLPPDTAGNLVDWIQALQDGIITPRANLYPSTEVRVRDQDIIFAETSQMKMVRFPHKPHTEWLDCNNCHESVFISKAGANQFGMFDILAGEFCGKCHGAVSFPLTECSRCHSVDRETFVGKPGAQLLIEDGNVDARVDMEEDDK